MTNTKKKDLKKLAHLVKTWFPKENSLEKQASPFSNQNFQKMTLSFGVRFYDKRASLSVGSFFERIKKLVMFLKEKPKVLLELMRAFDVNSIVNIPSKMKKIAELGLEYLRKAIDKAFQHYPLKIFTLPETKIIEISEILRKLIERYPKIKSFFKETLTPKIDYFEELMRRFLPTLSKIAMTAVFIWIWLASAEFEWNLKNLSDVIAGRITLAELLASLPAAGVGLIANLFATGMFTFFPYAVFARVFLLLAAKYVAWSGLEFRWNLKLFFEDFGLNPRDSFLKKIFGEVQRKKTKKWLL